MSVTASKARGEQGVRTDTHASVPRNRRWFWPSLLVLVAVAVAALVGWLLWTKSAEGGPEQSLELLAQAAEAGDWEGVSQYIDVEAVAVRYADASFSTATGDADAESANIGGAGMGGPTPGTGPSKMKTVYVEHVTGVLRADVEAGTLDAGAGGLESVLLVGKATDVTYSGETTASVTIEVPASGGDSEVVTLTMTHIGDYWRVVGLVGLTDLLGSAE